jgi:GH18 family chitinase
MAQQHRLRRPLVLLALLALPALALASCAGGPRVPLVPDRFRIPEGFRIVGYFPSWSGDPESIEYRALTHVCYAFARPTAEGSSEPIPNEEKLYRVSALAHEAGAEVLLSFGGGGEGDDLPLNAVAADISSTEAFIERVMDLISRYNLDGIDLDWEYPGEETSEDFARLVGSLAARLRAEGKTLSVAVGADGTHGRFCPDSAVEAADFLNVMAYDDGFGEPPGKNHSSYAFARSSLDYWIVERGAPRSKVVLGVPFYGRSLSDRHSISYYRLRKEHRVAAADDEAGGFGYNGFDTIRAKAVNQARYRAGGIMIWQLNQDADGEGSLLNAIYDAVKEPID